MLWGVKIYDVGVQIYDVGVQLQTKAVLII